MEAAIFFLFASSFSGLLDSGGSALRQSLSGPF
jgi:hypothetical protein